MSWCASGPSSVSRIRPGRAGVEPPDRVQPAPARDQVDDGLAPVGVLRGRDHPGGLVDRVDGAVALPRAGRPAVDLDPLAAVDVARRVAHDLARDRDAAAEDDLLGGAARGHAGVGEVLGEPASACHDRRVDLELLDETLRRRRRARLPRPPGVALDGQRRARLRGDDRPPRRAARAAGRRGPVLDRSSSSHEAHSADGTVKALFHTHDGRAVEAVMMRYRDGRRSICVSSQSGCPLTCTFCATGAMKFGRNLTASEILDQVLHFRRIEPVDHLVFMGMGEPMMNLDNVLASRAPAARRRHHPPPHDDLHRRLGARHRPARRERHADPAGVQPARARGRAALADHAGQRPLPARGRARRLRALLRASAAARSSSST